MTYGKREADRRREAVRERLEKVVALLNVDERRAEHRAVGGDQRQVDTERARTERERICAENISINCTSAAIIR